jgi:hypothetical protein
MQPNWLEQVPESSWVHGVSEPVHVALPAMHPDCASHVAVVVKVAHAKAVPPQVRPVESQVQPICAWHEVWSK